jgi:hypothetical protein
MIQSRMASHHKATVSKTSPRHRRLGEPDGGELRNLVSGVNKTADEVTQAPLARA